MRRDGTHTERELEELDRKVKDGAERCAGLLNEYKSDMTGLVVAYGRPNGSDKNGDFIVGLKLKGNRGSIVTALSVLFDDDTDLFCDVLEAISKLRPDLFKVKVLERPRQNGIAS